MVTRDDPIDHLRSVLAGRYAVEWEVGRGGMSRVYAARDLRHGRRVAIKVLRPELASILGADRFLREIEIAARLQHPHILPLFDSGEAGDLLFYVMPFVNGETLRARSPGWGGLRSRTPHGSRARSPMPLATRIARAWSTGTSSRRT
jgi:serine/threonine-protein kinase